MAVLSGLPLTRWQQYLAGLFAHVKRTVRAPVRVVGASWLYNLDADRGLFPEAYVADELVDPDGYLIRLWDEPSMAAK